MKIYPPKTNFKMFPYRIPRFSELIKGRLTRDNVQQGGNMSGVTVEGSDWREVLAKIGRSNNERNPMIEVSLWLDFNRDQKKPSQLFQFRSNCIGNSLSKDRLTRAQLEAEIKRALDAHFARVDRFEREQARIEAQAQRNILRAARKQLAVAKVQVKKLSKRR